LKIIKEFKSKKNNVYLVEDETRVFILKEFRTCENYLREKSHHLLIRNSYIKIPKIIKWDDNNCTLLMEYLEGMTALDAIEIAEKKEDSSYALSVLKSIFTWLEKFHSIEEIKSNKLSFNDMNFRNFIINSYSREELYGVDFESFEEGNFLSDIGKLIGMYLNYDEKYSEFKKSVKDEFLNFIVTEKYFSKKDLEKSIKDSITEIDNRRFNIT
jgi:tRNA A-37 threonylcarbamoyl transferase component Bud32